MFRRDHRAEALAVRIDHLMTSVVHHYFRFSWERVERGQVVMSGWIFGSLDESETIDRIVAFEGLDPAPSEGEH